MWEYVPDSIEYFVNSDILSIMIIMGITIIYGGVL